jgi:hypothetical protein
MRHLGSGGVHRIRLTVRCLLIAARPSGMRTATIPARLVQLLAVLALGYCALAISGCASMAPGEPKGPIMTVSAERPVQVGGVNAVYLSLTNDGVRTIDVDELHAFGNSVVADDAINVDPAIEAAGGADKLAAPLDHLPSTAAELISPVTTFIPGTKANRHSLGWLALATPIVPFEGAALLMVRSVVAVASPDRLRLMDATFYPGTSASEIARVGSGETRCGYVFFKGANYSAIEVSARDPKTFYRQTVRCPWHPGGENRCTDVDSNATGAGGR